MSSRWQVYSRKSDDLLKHLCLIRSLNPEKLKPDFLADLHDPLLLPDIGKAVELIALAKTKGHFVVVFGDYDADGTPASALLSLVFSRLGISHKVVLPSRKDGYGLSTDSIKNLPAETKLLITVDNGITAIEAVAEAKDKGLNVLIIDHHLPKAELPKADAIIDPFLPDNKYPFTGLCGCALAWKLAVALSLKFPKELTESFIKWLLDLVAISTVSDMMPLIDENRTLVHFGLEVMRKNRRPGVRAMLSKASIDPITLNSGTIGYSIGPRLNASGRLGDNTPSLELLLAEDDVLADKLSTDIEKANKQRQELVDGVLKKAQELIFKQNKEDDFCYLLLGEGWPSGVVGLVSGKLTNKYNRPVIVGTKSDDGKITASARSIDRYSIIDGLATQGGVLERFGGHTQAAGLSLTAENWPKFVDGLKSHVKSTLTLDDIAPHYLADALLTLPELSLLTVEACSVLQPFGLHNREPLFVVENVSLSQPRSLGASGSHYKWSAEKNGVEFEVIGFNFADKLKASGQTFQTANLLGYLEANTWRDTTKLQLRLIDIAPSTSQIELIDG